VKKAALALGAAAAAILIAPSPALAHGLGGITNLPVPGWLFLVGGGTVLVVSFIALGVLWQEPRLGSSGDGWAFPRTLSRVLLGRPLRVALQALGAGLLVLVWTAAAFGSERVSLNLAPTFVYVVFWVGITVLVVIVGNIWAAVDPWRAIADAVASSAHALGFRAQPRPYPERLGTWPAVALLLGFVTLELVYQDPADPRVLANAIVVYSAVTWTGMIVYGRAAWSRNGDGFALFFELLSRIALFGSRVRDGRREVILRRPLSGLTFVDRRPGIVVFVALMLGSVAFDGFSRASVWQDRIYSIRTAIEDPEQADLVVMGVNFLLLLVAVGIVAGAYTLAVRAAQRVAGPDSDLDGVFLGSLVPIAFVYALAHYLTYLLVQGQFALPLLSDPFGRGWDLLGTADFDPYLDVLTPNQTWYTQVIALVIGHVVGLVVAHDRAVALVSPAQRAVRTQYAMLALMVLYTVGGMWLLSLT
jgi:hypothetical protein